MLSEEKLNRINELAKKKKEGKLTPTEEKEQHQAGSQERSDNKKAYFPCDNLGAKCAYIGHT